MATSRRDFLAAFRSELPPALADWEGAQHLTRSLTAERGGGVAEAARLVLGMGTEQAEKVRALAYRLYSRSSANWWTDKAHAYNILVTPWPQSQTEAARLAAGVPEQTGFRFSEGRSTLTATERRILAWDMASPRSARPARCDRVFLVSIKPLH